MKKNLSLIANIAFLTLSLPVTSNAVREEPLRRQIIQIGTLNRTV